MKRFIIPLLLLAGCVQQATENKTQNKSPKKFDFPVIKAIEARSPIYLSKLNIDTASGNRVTEKVKKEIENVILDYYFKECMGDTNETHFKIKDVYINSVHFSDQKSDYYLVLLQHSPTSYLNSVLLCKDKSNSVFFKTKMDFNIFALYNFEKGKLKESNLKTQLKINDPEIELTDFNKDGKNELRIIRLNHNGTCNAKETAVVRLNENGVDTLFFKQKNFY